MQARVMKTTLMISTVLALFAAAACSSGTTTLPDTFEQEEGVDPQTDPQTDGTDPAADDPVREEGMCEPGQVLCGDKCVDTQTDPESCGECFNACTFPPNAGATCESGVCGWSCIAGWIDVDGDDTNGCECRSEGIGESTCDDGEDNDCDGDADCADADCEGIGCGEAGMICSGGSCACSLGEPPETDCGDGVDNDCDGAADCRDGDCGGESCGEATDMCCGTDCVDTLSNFYHCGICNNDCTSGQVCNLGVCGAACGTGLTDCGGSCVDTDTNEDHCSACFQPCPSRPNATRTCTAGVCGFVCASNFFDVDGDPLNGCECRRTSAGEAACGDLADNDCDGDVDCADADCNGMSCSAAGRICTGGNCLCPGGEVSESTCNDLSDNDCDGLVDCADLDCGGDACGPYGRVCSGFVCVCPGGEANELTCSDGLDNDCDGAFDCADGNCASRGCGAGGSICCALACVDIQTNNNHCGGCDNPCDVTQACVGGACTSTCTNDCTTLSRRCDPGGLNGYQECGQYDVDPCIEWSSTTLCSGAGICYNGQCCDSTAPGYVIINEVLYDGLSTDPQTVFIELWGDPGLDLSCFNLVGINGSNGAEYASIDLFGQTVPADGYFVIVHPSAAPALAAVADMQSAEADLQNDAESLQLRWGTGTVVDALGYGDSGVNFRGEGNFAPDVSPGHSLSRNRAHWDTNDNRADFHDDATPTPGRNDDPVYSISSVPEDFVDISATGTNTGLTDVDDSYVTVTMGFNFTFFGNTYDTVYVGTNGMVTFNSAYAGEYYNQEFPDGWTPNDVVACFWDDLYVRATDAIYYQLMGTAPNRSFIVQYNDLDFWEATPGTYNPATLTFEIILNENDGSIACQYSVMTSTPAPQKASGGSATVGLENADASDYVLHSYNDPSGVFSPGGLLFTPI